MPGFFKFLKGYNQYETDMSAWLSTSNYSPTDDELNQAYFNYTQGFRKFSDLHRMIITHTSSPQNITKFIRAIHLFIYTLKQLAPLRSQGLCRPLDELELDDNEPVPNASLWLHIYLALVETKPILEGIQWWGERVEINGNVKGATTKEKKESKSVQSPKNKQDPKPKAPKTTAKNTNIIVYDYDDIESSGGGSGMGVENSISSGKENSISGNGALINDVHGPDSGHSFSSSNGNTALIDAIAGQSTLTTSTTTGTVHDNGLLIDPLQKNTTRVPTSNKTVDEVVRPPNPCIVGMHDVWNRYNFSVANIVGELLALLETYRLSQANPNTAPSSPTNNNNPQSMFPSKPPPRLNTAVLPAGPPPKIKPVVNTPQPQEMQQIPQNLNNNGYNTPHDPQYGQYDAHNPYTSIDQNQYANPYHQQQDSHIQLNNKGESPPEYDVLF